MFQHNCYSNNFAHFSSILSNSIDELVEHGKNGFVFDTYLELSQQILTWFYDFPNDATLLSVKEEFSQRLQEFQSLRWDENWNENALPAFSN